MVYADGRSYNTGINTLHSIMRVTSATSGKSWAVDVTGKQLGINECCMTWTKYQATYVKDTKRIYKLGKMWLFFKAAQSIPGYYTLNTNINFDAADYVVQAIKKWASDEELAFSKMLHLTKKSYEQKQSGLIGVVEEAVCRFANEADYTKMASDAELWEKNNPGLRNELEQMLIDKVMPENSSIPSAYYPDPVPNGDGIHILDVDGMGDEDRMEMLRRFPGAKIHSL